MKIQTLLEELFGTDIKDINLNRNINTSLSPDNEERTGAFSYVSDKKNDPFIVRKTAHHDELHDSEKKNIENIDGYWKYIEGIVKNPELKDNPYFPRIYNIKYITGRNGNKIFRADIEKLEPFTNIDFDLALNYFKSIIELGVYSNKEMYKREQDLFTRACDIMRRCINTDNYFQIKDDNLKEALEYIAKLVNEGSELDIHRNNIMFRRGQYGIQMVITDPLGFIRANRQWS